MSKRNHPVDVAFFKRYAGFSYDPKTETQAQGKLRCARALAEAEAAATAAGCSYEWSIDPGASSRDWVERGDESRGYEDPWEVWQCLMLDPRGVPCASLHGIDFGRYGQPWGDTYMRVVEAELACEAGYPNPAQPFTVVGIKGGDEIVDWCDATSGEDAARIVKAKRGAGFDCVAVFAGNHSEVRS